MATSKELQAPAGHYSFVAPSWSRRVTVGLLFLFLLGLLASLSGVVRGMGTPAIAATAVCAVCVVGLWGLLQARIPQRIEVRKSIIEIVRDGHRHRYDLTDPGVELRVRDGEIAFAHYMSPWVVVRAKDVDWDVFLDVVMHYQNRADLNADLRDQRFNR